MPERTANSGAVPAAVGMEVDPPPPPPLLSLPGHLLALVVSAVQDKNGLRATCRSLRLAVNACTSSLIWPPPSAGGARLPTHLPAALTAACPGITLLNLSGKQGIYPRLEFSLSSCPPSLHTLLCSWTQVAQLGPLAACTTDLKLQLDLTGGLGAPIHMHNAADPQLQLLPAGVRPGPAVCVHDATDPQL